MAPLRDELVEKIKVLSETVWERRAGGTQLESWLGNFRDEVPEGRSERLHALWLLSQFMFFGSRQVRELLHALYRDLYKYPILESIRKSNNDTTDVDFLRKEFGQELSATRFLGMGNPSESGCHLLYYFRQENRLSRELFIHTHQIFARRGTPAKRVLRAPEVVRYVFIDDFCGSGRQAKAYSREVVEEVKSLNPNVKLHYLMLFATENGMREIHDATQFDRAKCLFELDGSYRCLGENSRYFVTSNPEIDKSFAERMCRTYGKKLWPDHPLGYEDGQLLIGFHYNTPDNTLPIIWYDEPERAPWSPIFRRYPKVYGWNAEQT